ncbi:MAG: molybdenum cofactor guanylyltransferase [Candidatus Nealsonbacteria bacterium]|nr:molybdenum cofactor guanylyltransferase [Candidatus Nealsonbacteria bacterium]
MGTAKAMLPFGPETMLQRVVRLTSGVVRPVVVVAAADQELPELPRTVRIVCDRQPDRGPLEALVVGLRALAEEEVDAAFITACDVPLLNPALIRRIIELSAGFDAAAPHIDGFYHPLVAVYRTQVLPEAEALLAADRLRPALLFDRVHTRRITTAELTIADPNLRSLANVNSPADYEAALAEARFA